MSEHEIIRKMLSNEAAGLLDLADQRRVAQHAAACPDCAAERERWQRIAAGLRGLPTPQPRPELVERVRLQAEHKLAAGAEYRQHIHSLVLLILLSWCVTLASWPVLKFVAGSVLAWLHVSFTPTWTWLAVYTAAGWFAAGAAAIALGLQHLATRRIR